MDSLKNIFWLALKELRSVLSDKVLVLFVLYAFTWTIYQQASGTSNEVNNASIAFADEDQTALSEELINAFYPPRFQYPVRIRTDEIERSMDEGRFMFVVVIPPQFERDLRAGRQPDVQVNIDATAMQQAGIGAGYIHNIITQRLSTYLKRTDVNTSGPVNLVQRKLFNPNGVSAWFSSIVAIINQLSLLTIVLTGAAVIREREHGTLEHLLVMPLTPFEIAMPKVVANGLVILIATMLSMFLVVRMVLNVPVHGSMLLWFGGVVLYLFFATALGVFLGTISRSMAQFALLIVLVVMVIQLLSGGGTPVESQPGWLQAITYFLPSRHFVSFSQIIIYRGGGLAAAWPNFAMVAVIGLAFFSYSVALFRKSIAVTK
ncbi:ABC transporter permease [Edaphobacter sp. HDX4]|uniref:ABC transporter permease n=1 Tax=Edaphobacter sp. HDX4 TaxID=2794064 RepID=UPI002FE6B516